MNLDDFFLRIDEKLKITKENENLPKVATDRNLKILKEAVNHIAPLVENYAAKLQERNLKADIRNSDESIELSLTYKDGSHRTITLGSTSREKLIGIAVEHVDSSGGTVISLDDSHSYDSESWEDNIYEKHLRKFIEDFISCAESHGGV
ncbi:hypothetical protein [Pseudomonas sp. NBRC 100443]|uniref:hypothetical protein n=1 Tax=Pseudomonas sp. NBRC 100443 TaxID=1113665 RepID=UPI0024A301A0|nr:hypothetical protein [Pseudomonas sp. NBRC 100443]GLU37400.1 hypothetical protein Pssp01_14930 [Pseudomonas sp. NBRC 100443]